MKIKAALRIINKRDVIADPLNSGAMWDKDFGINHDDILSALLFEPIVQ